MVTTSFFHLKVPEAEALENLAGISFDLSQVTHFCSEYRKLYDARASNAAFLLTPYTIAIHVLFIRATSSGVRKLGAEGLLDCLTAEERKRHQYFKDVRDKHIAHSVNAMEENYARAHFIVEEPEKGITSIGHAGHHISGMAGSEAEVLENIATKLLKEVKRRIKIQEGLLRTIADRINPADYERLAEESTMHKETYDVSKRRQ